ncbi:MAG: sulfotransferase [Prochloraceae cyanobacterium]|nr:sulfotransferase [Prochloraceae cyanobacterium]
MKQTPKTKVLYIASQERSGSTLISQILGQLHGFISVGELYIIWRYGLMENRLCGCSVSFNDCQFWQEVLEKADLGQIDPQKMFQLSRKLVRYFPLAFLPGGSKFLMSLLGNYPATVEKLYSKIPTITGSRVIIDASKSLVHYYLLSQLPTLDVYLVHLVRDPRGVEFSLIKRKLQGVPEFLHHSLVKGSLAWTAKNILMEWLGNKTPDRYLRIRYEDFVRQPDLNLRKICNLLQEDVVSLPLVKNNQFTVTSNHVIAGSPQRFRSGVDRLKLDEAWKEKMTANDLQKVTLLTFPLLARYEYHND